MATENGWEPSHAPEELLEWRTIPGTNPKVSLRFMKGWPSTILTAYAADYHAYIEPLRDADSASFTPTNSVATSNHLNGSAMDLNWNSHQFKVNYAGFDEAKIKRMRDLLAFYNFEGLQIVFWAQDWNSPKDAMHHQMGYDTWKNPKVLRFIEQRIRPDGFSTYQRGGSTVTPPVAPPAAGLTRAEGYAARIIAEGRRRNITPKGIQIALATGIVESNITVYANEKLPKSLALPHDAVGRDGLSVGIFQQQVKDSGNGWWWGDEKTCMGVESSAGLFYDRLVKLPYDGTSKTPGAFAQQIQGSAFPARYDQHWGEAVALYNKLAGGVTTPASPPAPSTQGDAELSAEAERMIRVIHDEVTKQFKSRSPLRHVSEGFVDTTAGFILNIDAHEHVEIITKLASYGDPDALDLLREVANNTEAGREHDAQLAQNILADLYDTTGGATATVRAPEQVSYTTLSVPEQMPVLNASTASSKGQIIGQAYDALEALLDANALTDAEKAPLTALIGVLQTKTEGEQS